MHVNIAKYTCMIHVNYNAKELSDNHNPKSGSWESLWEK